MQHRRIRITISVLTASIALTAIGGGFAILTGVDEFPPEWLRDTPFDGYTVPALLLAVAVGGSALLASVAVLARRDFGALVSMVAGFIMAGYIVGEVLLLKQVPPGPTAVEGLYFGLGLLVFGLGFYLWHAERRHAHRTSEEAGA